MSRVFPESGEVSGWQRGAEREIDNQAELYAAIDGGSPKYIERGWVRSRYVDYVNGSMTLHMKASDMGTEQNALAIWQFDLPSAWEPIGDGSVSVLNVGLDRSYESKSHVRSFYIEIAVDDSSDAAKQQIVSFTQRVLARAD